MSLSSQRTCLRICMGLVCCLFAVVVAGSGCPFDTTSTDPDSDDGVVASGAVVDTGQSACYAEPLEMTCPAAGEAYYGQDAQYSGKSPSYTLSSDGMTVVDDNTGLTWQRSPDTDRDGDVDIDDELTWTQAQAYPATLNAEKYGGYDDWRLPSIKELYSLIDFSGTDPSGYEGADTSGLVPFIDTTYFDFAYGDTNAGKRVIDAQYASDTLSVSTVNGEQLFGVNFADGRIKGYFTTAGGRAQVFFMKCVRGDVYGVNDFVDNGDNTVTDQNTGLMWMQNDSGVAYDWAAALAYAENLSFAGHDDWRLPNAKELQGIVDYTRSPSTTGSAAIDPLFNSTAITDAEGGANYAYYWTGTTHVKWISLSPGHAAYVAFGEALGWTQATPGGAYELLDWHGAGAQRSDPKSGDAAAYPHGHGPQLDVIRIQNYVRCVRDGS